MLGPDPLATLAKALKALRPGAPTDALKPPMFNWQTTKQYEDFHLFCRSLESWYCLQGMKEEPTIQPGFSTCLTSMPPLANGNTSNRNLQVPPELTVKIRRKALLHSSNTSSLQWSPHVSIMQNLSAGRCLHMSWWNPWWGCRMHLWPHWPLWFSLSWREGKGYTILFFHALSDSDLVCKLLALKLTATTSKMLELCCMHITISDNMNAMGLTGSKTVSAICCQKQQHQWQQPQQQKSHTTSTSQHTCSNCTKSHVPGRSSCPAKDSVCSGCSCTGHWWPCCRSSSGPQAIKKMEGTKKKQGDFHHNC